MKTNDFDVAIIGGGAAGLSAALWCDDLGLRAVLLESASELGGQLLRVYNPILNHLGSRAETGRELRDSFIEQLENRKFRLELDSFVREFDFEEKTVSTKRGEIFRVASIIIATGVRRRKLRVAGEEEFCGKGIIESGKKDGKLTEGKRIAVIGGGDAALENSLILSEFASEVFLINRSGEFRARSEFLEAARKIPKVKILTETIVKKISGGESVENLELENAGKFQNLPVDFVLIRIGVEPNTELFRDKLELDRAGYIKVDSRCATSLENVYAVGDAANPASPTVSSAVGMGATAVKAIFSK